tara:strand:- start:826 stop:2748 length:1923 start_codon:yes stop_codon:yes gene_type:complete
MAMQQLRFKPEASKKIAQSIGYTGDISNRKQYSNFLQQNPDARKLMKQYRQTAIQMAMGGLNMQTGGAVPTVATPLGAVQQTPLAPAPTAESKIEDTAIQRLFQPGLPTGAVTQPVSTQVTADQTITPTSGQVTGDRTTTQGVADTTVAVAAPQSPAAQMVAATAAPQVQQAVTDIQAAQTALPTQAQVTAQQANESSVSQVQEAQGTAVALVNPIQRQIESGEIISSAANAQTAAQFTEQVEAAQASPSQQATVQGQFEALMATFDETNPPAWASGAIRTAQAELSRRGLGNSSIAGQAIIQAVMESALPIAQADAQIISSFEAQNLSNRQQRAVLAAQQRAAFIGQEFTQEFQSRVQNSARIGDIANANFTSEQQIALENSRVANTVNLQNLNNRQAVVMAEAASLANLDQANLNNRQQAAVQNAQNFLQVDMANLSNRQQIDLFKGQQRIQSLFTDQAATNASAQFNATSQNQLEQFFSQLQTQTAQFNSSQSNAQNQFNAGQFNNIGKFNTEIANQRDQFNAKNRLVIDQSNAVWRRQIATAATQAVNRANEVNAKAVLGISDAAYNDLWQHYSDLIEFAVTSADNELDRNASIAIAELNAEAESDVAAKNSSSQSGRVLGGIIGKIGTSIIGGLF